MTRRQRLRATSQDLHEIDTLFDLKLELEEQQLRVAARRIAANRKLEDVAYWREHSGWFDDDESMNEYNTGVYTSLYTDQNSEGGTSLINSKALRTAAQIGGALVGVLVLFVLVRAFSRTSASKKNANRRRAASRSRSKSRARSKSRTRSRSRRREKEANTDNTDKYELMENTPS